MANPALPGSFPCWVKAIYSFGGETKRDLGFLEGDYIECLNAGDGSWWTGRLKRDPRIIGKFPSNFVKVLDVDSLPPSLAGSPMPARNAIRQASRADSTPPSSGNTTPVKQKSMFRRPFSAHTAATSPGSTVSVKSPKVEVKPKKTFAPYSSMKQLNQASAQPKQAPQRPPSPKIPLPIARGGMPRPVQHAAPSPQPAAPPHRVAITRSPSPAPMESIETPDASPPPPPPPAHRVTYSQQQQQEQHYTSPAAPYRPHYNNAAPQNARSPSAELHYHSGLTPSPLRDAMDDVMSSLHGMRTDDHPEELHEDEQPEGPIDMWSPDGYNDVYEQSAQEMYDEPADDYAADEEDDVFGGAEPAQSSPAAFANGHMPPREDHNAMREYVQRMQDRLERLHEENEGHVAADESFQRPTSGYGEPSRGGGGGGGGYSYGMSRPGSSSGPVSRPGSSYGRESRPTSSYGQQSRPNSAFADRSRGSESYYNSLRRKMSRKGPKEAKSAYELGRTGTIRSSVTTASSNAHSTSTNHTNSTQITTPSLMSGHSAGGFSATSAGSLARRKFGPGGNERPVSAMEAHATGGGSLSGYSYHDSHASNERAELSHEAGSFGGLTSPAGKRRNLFQRLRDTAKTSAASARSNISSNGVRESPLRPKSALANGISSITGGIGSRDAARDMGLGGTPDRSAGVDWVQMRRDVNRANSLSRNERNERSERCLTMDLPVVSPVDSLNENAEGDESADGYPVTRPTDFQIGNLAMVDKNARFVSSLPGVVNATSLAQSHLCRQYRSDVQRLRAIFTWVSERIGWEEEAEGHRDSRRVISSRRGSSEEIAYLVAEMCMAAGFQAEVVRGYLKTPGEAFSARDLGEAAARPNHWWNAVVCDGEWRMLDCALANPSNPRRAAYSSASGQVAETWYFLARPLEMCYTHVPLLPEQQHICPPQPHEVLMALPTASPTFFKNGCQMWDYDTGLFHMEGLEMAHIQLAVPDDVEVNAEVEAHTLARDPDGDLFESGEVERAAALAQAEFVTVPEAPDAPFKRYTIKAVLPAGVQVGTAGRLNVYAGKRGLQHGLASNPHNRALCLPLVHDGGPNPPFGFFVRHPTPHALRHELYVMGPLCRTLALNNTFVFAVRQHPAGGVASSSGAPGLSISRPGSALSMASASQASSSHSGGGGGAAASDADEKPAKLAVQSPSGKILRMSRKPGPAHDGEAEVARVGSVYESIIKIGERGTWRGLVLADRSARWCVFGEWEAV